jgi:cell division protein FtsZ
MTKDMFDYIETKSSQARLKVIGVGGGGGNALAHMIEQSIAEVEFICANTDLQVLKKSKAHHQIQLGDLRTQGLGAGANPTVGKEAAEESKDQITQVLQETDMVFITAGMGGGTGTGASPVIAQIAKDMGILTVAVVTMPFSFEGKKRMDVAQQGIGLLTDIVDSLIVIPNDKLMKVLGKQMSLLNAFKAANGILQGAVQGIAELITRPGLINVDFADVRTVMSIQGKAMMGSASGSGEDRASVAADQAISSPLLEDVDLSGAQGVLVNITSGPDLSIGEFEVVGNTVRDFVSEDATVVVGTVIDPELTNELKVTVVVTGLVAKQASTLDEPIDISVTPSVAIEKNQDPSFLHHGETDTSQLSELEIPAYLRRDTAKKDTE